MDPLNPEEPYQLFPQQQQQQQPPVATAQATISAQPQLRDLQKELTTLVPTAVRRKLDTATDSNRYSHDTRNQDGTSMAKRIRVNTAPGLQTPDTVSLSTSAAKPASQPPPPPTSQASTSNKAAPKKLQDEYSNFMKEMEGLM
ncbi:hypothetical protein BDF19DRAFT_452392 [Syncephalis fuscata]|nr:hypothetical protein BDF19DRAFT_452392 [Syncephalis fuscata]